MNDVDRANQAHDTLLNAAIANRVRYEGESAHECEECGNAIPERRRESIAGTKHCVECADWLQRRGLL